MSVFYLGVDAVEIKGDVVVSNGRGMFTGPLKLDTEQEKDMLVRALPGMPPTFRARLDRPTVAAMIAVTINENSGRSHAIALELLEVDLVALSAGQISGTST
jgi:hypothetical protein